MHETYKTNGIGIITTEMPPRTEHAWPTPRLWKNAVEQVSVYILYPY